LKDLTVRDWFTARGIDYMNLVDPPQANNFKFVVCVMPNSMVDKNEAVIVNSEDFSKNYGSKNSAYVVSLYDAPAGMHGYGFNLNLGQLPFQHKR